MSVDTHRREAEQIVEDWLCTIPPLDRVGNLRLSDKEALVSAIIRNSVAFDERAKSKVGHAIDEIIESIEYRRWDLEKSI